MKHCVVESKQMLPIINKSRYMVLTRAKRQDTIEKVQHSNGLLPIKP